MFERIQLDRVAHAGDHLGAAIHGDGGRVATQVGRCACVALPDVGVALLVSLVGCCLAALVPFGIKCEACCDDATHIMSNLNEYYPLISKA